MTMLSLEAGRTRATIAPGYGGRVAQLSVLDGASWLPLLFDDASTPVDQRDPMHWGCVAMAPWPNRIAGAQFTFDGREYTLPANAPPHALHGFGYDARWDVETADASSCTLTLDLPPAWPFGGRVIQRIQLFDDGLTWVIEVHAGDVPMPAGAGWHPWFRTDVRPGADVRLRLDALQRYELDDMISTGRLLPVTGDFDLRSAPPAGDRRLDDCYAGVTAMSVAWGDLSLTIERSPNVSHAVVFTPDHAVCLEPQTCAIDAFNLESRGIDAGMTSSRPDARSWRRRRGGGK